MAIELTAAYNEVIRTINGLKPDVFSKVVAEVIAGGVTIPVMAVVEDTEERFFDRRFATQRKVELMIGAGTYLYDIYPWRRDLKIRLYRIPVGAASNIPLQNIAIETTEYKAVLFDTRDLSVEGNGRESIDKRAMDLTTLDKYTFQLIDPITEQLRLIQVGGIFSNVVPGVLLRTLLTQYSNTIDIDPTLKPLGVDLRPPSNNNKRMSVLIPHGKPLLDNQNDVGIAGYLQKTYGIYNAGIGCYYQKRHWYVYPLFDCQQYDKSSRKAMIVNVPDKDMRGVETTYRQEGKNLFIVATGEVSYVDRSEHDQMNLGNGARFAGAEIFNNFATGKGNEAVVDRSAVLSEFVVDNNPGNLNNAAFSSERITTNPYYQASKLSPRLGGQISLKWENSNPDILTPGLPIRVLYTRSGEVRALDGVLLAVETSNRMEGTVGAITRHRRTSILSLFVTRSEIDNKKTQ